jgi:hypothetical protein
MLDPGNPLDIKVKSPEFILAVLPGAKTTAKLARGQYRMIPQWSEVGGENVHLFVLEGNHNLGAEPHYLERAHRKGLIFISQ